MSESRTYFGMSGNDFGEAVMCAMRWAMTEIRRRRWSFEKSEKGLTGSGETDYVTDVDEMVQEMYVKNFSRAFEGIGLIGEEGGLRIPSTAGGEDIVLTLDPLDGTNAFVRGQSHGISTMVGVLVGGCLAGGYVGDVMTGEIYAAHPGEWGAWLYEPGETLAAISKRSSAPLSEQYALLRKSPGRYSLVTRQAASADLVGGAGLFRDFLVDTGSIGLHFARLWKGEIGGFFIEDSTVTPWDQTPCYAISKRLEIAQIVLEKGRGPYRTSYAPVLDVRKSGAEYLYVKQNRADDFVEWFRSAFPNVSLEGPF